MSRRSDMVEEPGTAEAEAVASPARKGAVAGKRRMAREMAVQMLYQWDLGESPLAQVFAAFDLTDYLGPTRPVDRARARAVGEDSAARRHRVDEAFRYARRLVEGTATHREEVDRLIREQADNWRLERMPAVDRNILRLAVFELLYEQDVPKLVVMDEAIELAKRFGSEQSGRFVNGLLDGLLKQRSFPGKMS